MTISQKIDIPEFLKGEAKGHFIDGEWRPSISGEEIETRNPSTGAVLARLARGRKADVDAAVVAARRAFESGPWSRSTPESRQALLMKVADLLVRNWDELAMLETLDMGVPMSRSIGTRDRVVQMIAFFATQTANCTGRTIPNSLPGSFTTMTVKAPIGVVGGIIPWNGPLISQWWVLGGALATGCTVVLKPAEDASLTPLRIAELLIEAGLPKGVVNVVTGLGAEAGAALSAHPDVDRVAFTGSTVTGREVIRNSAVNIKRLQLELGGKSPDIVFADADLGKAVPGTAMAVYSNSGQVCYAGTRLLVQRSIHDRFVDELVKFTRTVKVGDPFDMQMQLGPLISERQLDRVMGYVDAGRNEGADLAVGGGRMGGDLASGYFLEPTVFANVNNRMTIAREEIFGPVISVIPFDSVEEALTLANDTPYGLGSAVWTQSVRTMNRMMHGIKAGSVWVNCYGVIDMAVGFGGTKQSGYGWKGGYEYVDGFLYQKAITINAN